jgi:4'-phosphopantetheinyl transferase
VHVRRSALVTDRPGPRERDVAEDEVGLSLWWAPLDIPESSVRGLAGCLSSEERERADRYEHLVDRQRFLAAHGWLRHLLGRQLGCGPEEVPIISGGNGKPRVAGSDLRFNAARSADVAFFGIREMREIGVDIEAIRSSGDIDEVGKKFFSAREQKALASVAPESRLAASFACWTRK